MACKFEYHNIEFNSEEDLKQFVEDVNAGKIKLTSRTSILKEMGIHKATNLSPLAVNLAKAKVAKYNKANKTDYFIKIVNAGEKDNFKIDTITDKNFGKPKAVVKYKPYSEIKRLQQQQEFDRLSKESNTYVNEDGDVVNKDDLKYPKLQSQDMGIYRENVKYKRITAQNRNNKEFKEILNKFKIKQVKSHFYYVLNDEQQKSVKSWLRLASKNSDEQKRLIGSTRKGFEIESRDKSTTNWEKGTVTIKIIKGNTYLLIEDQDKELDSFDNYKFYRYPVKGFYMIPIDIVSNNEERDYLYADKNQTLYVPFLQKEINKYLIKTKGISAKKSANYYLLQIKSLIKNSLNAINDKEYSFEELKNLSSDDVDKIYKDLEIDNQIEIIKTKFKNYITSLDKQSVINEILDLYNSHLSTAESTTNIRDLEKILNYLPEEFLKLITFKYVNYETAYFSSQTEKNITEFDELRKIADITDMRMGLAINVAIRKMKEDGVISDSEINHINNELTPAIQEYLNLKSKNPQLADCLKNAIIKKFKKIKSVSPAVRKQFKQYLDNAYDSIDEESHIQNKGLTYLVELIVDKIEPLNTVFSEITLGELNINDLKFKYDKIVVALHEMGHGLDKYLFVTHPEERKKIINFIEELKSTSQFQNYLQQGLNSRGYSNKNNKEITADLYAYLISQAINKDVSDSHLKSLDDFFKNNYDLAQEIFNNHFDIKYKQLNTSSTLNVNTNKLSIVELIKDFINEIILKVNKLIGKPYFKYISNISNNIETKFPENNIQLVNLFDRLRDIIMDTSNFDIDSILDSDLNEEDFHTQGIQEPNNQQIKSGVAELFESNPELANAVYEALGIKQKQYASKLKQISERRKLATKSDLENSKLIKDIRVDKSQPKDIKPNEADKNLASIMLYGHRYSDLSNMEYIDGNLSTITNPAEMQLEAEVLAYRILNDLLFDIKEITEFYEEIKDNPEYASALTTNENPIKEFFENDIFEQVEKENLQITPQQKQQAQQLYSQYLDTIFPDSKVKDIVYHGKISEKPISKSKPDAQYGSAYYFTSKLKNTKEFGNNIIQAIVNIKNPSLDAFEDSGSFTAKRMVEILNQKGYDAIDETSKEYPAQLVVFESEQIHILGSKQDINGFKEFVNNNGQGELFQLKEPETRNQKTYNELDVDLRTRMFAILNKLGVSVTSIDTMMLDYGVDALGVADFMNKAIKLAKDEATDFTFMEEFVHFVTASLGDNHPLITRLHTLIKETDFYEAVKEQYNAQGITDERIIVKEAADKAIAELMLKENNVLPSSLGQRIVNLIQKIWNKFLEYWVGLSQNQIENEINIVLGELRDEILSRENFDETTETANFFNVRPDEELADDVKLVKESIKQLTYRLNKLKRDYGKEDERTKRTQTVINDLETKLAEEKYNEALVYFIQAAKEDVKKLTKLMNDIKTGVNNKEFTSAELIDWKDFVDYYQPVLKAIKDHLHDTDKKTYKKSIKTTINLDSSLNTLLTFYIKLIKKDFIKRHSPYINRITEKFRPDINKLYNEKTGDINLLQYYTGSLRNAGDEILRTVYEIYFQAKHKVDVYVLNKGKELTTLSEGVTREQYKYFYETDENGKKTGYISRVFNYDKFKKARDKFYTNLIAELDLPKDYDERKELLESDKDLKKKWNARIRKWYVTDKNMTVVPGYEDIEKISNKMHAELSAREYREWYDRNIHEYKGKYSYTFNSEYMQPNPSLSKYGNADYLKIQSNEQLTSLYDRLLDEKRESDSKLTTETELYLLPQISKTLLDRMLSGASKEEIAEAMKDGFMTRVDDTEYGENEEDDKIIYRPDGSQVKLVPIHFTRKLENLDDLSENLVSIMIKYIEMAENFKQMAIVAPELEITKRIMGERKHVIKGKIERGFETNTYKALDTFLDMNVYGATKELLETTVFGYKVNVTKIIDKANAYIRANNLVFNLFVSVANWTTGEIYSKIEDFVGQRTTNESSLWANLQFGKSLQEGALMDTGAINKKHKLSLLLERHRIMQSNAEIFANVDKERYQRLAGTAAYSSHQIGDYKIKGTLALSIYDNYRLYNGEFINRAQFRRLKGIRYRPGTIGQTAERAEALKLADEEWSALREKSLWNAIEVDGNIIKVKDEYKDAYSDAFYARLTAEINTLASEIDGVVSEQDRAQIQRGAWTQLIMTHRGWLVTGLQKRLKSKGFNYQFGEMDEGYYRTFGRVLMEGITKSIKEKKISELLMTWNTLDDFEKMNVMRALYDYAFILALYTVARILNSLAGDDDDDDWTINFMAYMANRTLVEISALTPPFIFNELDAILNSPVAGANQLNQILNFMGFFNTDELESGMYEGKMKLTRKFIKMTPGLKGFYENFYPGEKNKYIRYYNLGMFPGL